MNSRQHGFTLMELMIVVSIVSILVAMAIPSYQQYAVRSKIAEAFVMLDQARTGVAEYYTSQGAMPDDATAAGVETAINSQYVEELAYARTTPNVAQLSARLTALGGSVPNGQTVVFEATGSGGGVRWECVPGTLPAKYLPSYCR